MKFLKNKLIAILAIILGGIATLPFIINVFVLGKNYHEITYSIMIMTTMFMIGGTSMLMGIIELMVNNPGYSGSTSDQDVSRIRFVAEREMMDKK